MAIEVTAAQMLALGLDLIGYNEARLANKSEEKKNECFRRAFGASALVCAIIFHDLQEYDLPEDITINKPKPKPFLMCMNWLKRYQVEIMLSATFGYHEDTVRKYNWMYAQGIQALKTYKV